MNRKASALGLTIGSLLRAERRARGWTARSLSAAARVHPTLLSGFENGKRIPTLPVLLRLSDALGLPPSLLLGPGPGAKAHDRALPAEIRTLLPRLRLLARAELRGWAGDARVLLDRREQLARARSSERARDAVRAVRNALDGGRAEEARTWLARAEAASRAALDLALREEIRVLRARAMIETGRHREAEGLLRAVSTGPASQDLREEVCRERARVALALGRPGEARRHLRHALASDPGPAGKAGLYRLLGEIECASGRPAEGAAAFRRAASSAARAGDAVMEVRAIAGLGRALARARRFREALRASELALAKARAGRSPEAVHALVARAEVRLRAGQLAEARRDARSAADAAELLGLPREAARARSLTRARVSARIVRGRSRRPVPACDVPIV